MSLDAFKVLYPHKQILLPKKIKSFCKRMRVLSLTFKP